MAPRTILHLIDTGGPGGAETIFLELVARLDPSRWRSIAVVPWEDWLSAALRARGIDPILVPAEGSFNLGYLSRLLRLIRHRHVDLVHGHLLGSAVYGNLAGRLSRRPTVATFHGVVDIYGEAYLRWKFRLMDRRPGRAVFVSESLRRAILEVHSLRRTATAVIHNGIDTALFRPTDDRSLRQELAIPSQAVMVAAVGNIRPAKAYADLLRAAALLRERSAAYYVVIAGDSRGALAEDLIRLRDSLGLAGSVHFLGFREDVRRVLAAADLYALSSTAEGFSLSTIQAMACGRPVVATRSGGPEEIVEDGTTGVLVPPGDPAALAMAIDSLWNDPVRRRRFVTAAREVVERRFSMDAMVGGYEALYEHCLAPRTGPHGRVLEPQAPQPAIDRG